MHYNLRHGQAIKQVHRASGSRQEIEMTKVTYNGQEIDMAAARQLMDDEICEQIHGTVDTDQEFMDAYAVAHEEKFGAEFAFN